MRAMKEAMLLKLLTILIRVFEPENGKIVTRHLDAIGITDLTAGGIFSSLAETLSKYHLPCDQLLSLASDTCNVMKGAKNGVITKLRAKQPKVIDVHCTCHVVDLCVESTVKVIPKVDDLLVLPLSS